MSLNKQSLVYLGGFMALWLILEYLSATIGIFGALVVGTASYFLLKRFEKTTFAWWQAALVGIILAEVFFALTFWSTATYNKALALLAILFIFGQWFDRINLKWLIAFLLMLLMALLLVPFQVL